MTANIKPAGPDISSAYKILESFLDEEILVTPEELKQKADETTKAILQMETAFDSLKILISNTSGYWEGTAGNSFRSMFRDRETDIDNMLSGLKKYPSKLLQIAGLYVEDEKKITEEHTALPANVL